MIDTNKLLREHGINHPQAFQTAHVLAKNGLDPEDIIRQVQEMYGSNVKLETNPAPYKVIGLPGIDIASNAIDQMDLVMRIPPAVYGALLPDAHLGYAMPIGGVVALENAVSPSFVGFDIACRMMVTVLGGLSVEDVDKRSIREDLLDIMQYVTRFGVGAEFEVGDRSHPVMQHPSWDQIPFMRDLLPKAWRQLGTSGAGNHFFDLLVGTIVRESDHFLDPNGLPLPEGTQFVAIMSHSGSRRPGYETAQHYQRLAKRETKAIAHGIPNGYEWLRMDTEAGKEYWAAMQLMGEYAKANHELIHQHFLQESHYYPQYQFQNHHNFAWAVGNGNYIHRKGATPAEPGQIGVIPGSSGTASFIVEGLGDLETLQSSSHGAGRNDSRANAKKMLDVEEYNAHMKFKDVWARGVAADETYQAYKDIWRVMALQDGTQVKILAVMDPVLVVMGGSDVRKKG